MPTYVYDCSTCHTTTEIVHGMTERARRKCPHCGARALERRISGGAGVVFRGPGFHCNDYPSRPHRKIPDREFVDMATAAAKERD